VLLPPLADAAATSQESPSKVLVAMKTWFGNAKPHTSSTMAFAATVFTMEIKTPTSP
jgi:hypothetical protein